MVVSTVRHEQGGAPGGQEPILAELASTEVRKSPVGKQDSGERMGKTGGDSILVHESGRGDMSS